MRNRFFRSVAVILGALSVNVAWGQSNPNNPNAQIIQGPGPSGNEGYPINVSPAVGSGNFPVAIMAGGGGAVTQGTSPWIVGQDAGSNPWIVGPSEGPLQTATLSVSGQSLTVTTNGANSILASLSFSGAWSGFLVFRWTVDGVNWNFFSVTDLGQRNTTFDFDATWGGLTELVSVPVAGASQIQFIAFGITAGSVTVGARTSDAEPLPMLCYPGSEVPADKQAPGVSVVPRLYDSGTFNLEAIRSAASQVGGVPGVDLAPSAAFGYDGANFQYVGVNASHALKTEVQGFSFGHLAANATTTLKSGSGTLHSVAINTLGLTDTVTLYDNTAGSGAVIAVINAAVSQGTLLYDLNFGTGLTAVIAGTTAPDVTISYR